MSRKVGKQQLIFEKSKTPLFLLFFIYAAATILYYLSLFIFQFAFHFFPPILILVNN